MYHKKHKLNNNPMMTKIIKLLIDCTFLYFTWFNSLAKIFKLKHISEIVIYYVNKKIWKSKHEIDIFFTLTLLLNDET